MAVAESMAAGRGVMITTGCGGAQEYIRDGENGLVVPTGDVQLMAARLAALAQDRVAIRRMGSSARTTAFAHLGTDALHERYRTFMQGVLRGHTDGVRCERGEQVGDHNRTYGYIYTMIVRALRGLGPVSDRELTSWRTAWLAELNECNITIDADSLCTPHRGPVLHAQACIQRLTSHLRATGAGCIAFMGAGAFTRRLAYACGGLGGLCDFVIDDAPPDDGQLAGVPVVTPMALPRMPDVVIICSDEYGHVLAARAREVLPVHTKVFAYNDLPHPAASIAA